MPRAALIFLGIVCAHAAHAELRAVDDFGREVVLSAPAARIISTAPHNTENLFSAGAGDKIVGLIGPADYPPAARDIPEVGDYARLNLESVLELKPDLIVAWRTAANTRALQRLENFGFAVYYSEPRAFADIIDNIEDLATLAGTRDLIDPATREVTAVLDAARARFARKQTLRVFYQVWRDPLMTLNGEHYVSRILELCGAQNIFADLKVIAPQVGIESVVAANPDVIVAGKVGGAAPDMSDWNRRKLVKAVQNQSYVFVDSQSFHRHTLRTLQSIPKFCEALDAHRD